MARREEQVGVISEGFRTTALPADNAPISGSSDNPENKDTKSQGSTSTV